MKKVHFWLSTKNLVLLVLALIALILPTTGNEFWLFALSSYFIMAMLGVSLNLIFGYTGQISVAHGAFFGIGAYTYGILTTQADLNCWLAMAIGATLAFIIAYLVGIVALRTRGAYFVIVTLGFSIIMTVLVSHIIPFCGGVDGLFGLPKLEPLGSGFKTIVAEYYLNLAFLVLFLLITNHLVSSWLGRSFKSIRDNEELAESLAIDTMKMKILSFAISAFFAGTAGALHASLTSTVVPADIGFHMGFTAIIFLSVGGAGTLMGPVVGTFVMGWISEALRTVVGLVDTIYGLALILLVLFFPSGIVGTLKSVWLHAFRLRGEGAK
jgi:branched-chain amino acid transport system permease protein